MLWRSITPALAQALVRPATKVRSRAGEILIANFDDRDSDPSFREAWRKAVPALAKATQASDIKVRNGALAILGKLGPEAREALPALSSLADHAEDASVKSAATEAINSISSVDDLKTQDPARRAAAATAIGRAESNRPGGKSRRGTHTGQSLFNE